MKKQEAVGDRWCMGNLESTNNLLTGSMAWQSARTSAWWTNTGAFAAGHAFPPATLIPAQQAIRCQ